MTLVQVIQRRRQFAGCGIDQQDLARSRPWRLRRRGDDLGSRRQRVDAAARAALDLPANGALVAPFRRTAGRVGRRGPDHERLVLAGRADSFARGRRTSTRAAGAVWPRKFSRSQGIPSGLPLIGKSFAALASRAVASQSRVWRGTVCSLGKLPRLRLSRHAACRQESVVCDSAGSESLGRRRRRSVGRCGCVRCRRQRWSFTAASDRHVVRHLTDSAAAQLGDCSRPELRIPPARRPIVRRRQQARDDRKATSQVNSWIVPVCVVLRRPAASPRERFPPRMRR